METLFLIPQQIKRIIKRKRELEKELKIKLVFSENSVLISGAPLDEYAAVQILNALSLGFELGMALLLQQEDYMLRTINIKDYIKHFSPARLKQVKARIIGKQGKALKTISQLSDCAVKLSNNTLAIIGRVENVRIAEKSFISLIRGSEHSHVYASLEKLESEELTETDLGLKGKE